MTTLNDASAIYYGSIPVSRVYAGAQLVWEDALGKLKSLAGDKGAIWLPGVSKCWQDAAMTVPAGDGDPVRVIEDISGNGFHFISPNDSSRPLREFADGYWGFVFDGVDDYMTAPSFGVPSWPHDGSGATIAIAVDDLTPPSGNQYGLFGTHHMPVTDRPLSPEVGFQILTTSLGGYWRVSISAPGDVFNTTGGSTSATRLVTLEHSKSGSPQWSTNLNGSPGNSGDYGIAPSASPASSVPCLMRTTNLSRYVQGRWHGACLLPVTGHSDLVDQVLQAYMPPITEPAS